MIRFAPIIEERFDRAVSATRHALKPYAGRWTYLTTAERAARNLCGGYLLGLYIRPHRVFAPGDVVLLWLDNGAGERYRAYGYSTKKRASIRGLYVQAQRWRDNLTIDAELRVFSFPPELAQVELAGAAPRAHASGVLRAAQAARRVSSDSPAQTTTQETENDNAGESKP